MSQPLDDVVIMDGTSKDNGTWNFTLPDGFVVQAQMESGPDGSLSSGQVISWCEHVREDHKSREQAKEAEMVENRAERPPDPSRNATGTPPTPIEYAEAQVKAMEIMYDRVSIELQEALKQAEHYSVDLKETEQMGKQWQEILDSLTETDAELQLRKKREVDE